MKTKFILIRHGRTQWNREDKYLSYTDIDMDEYGVGQIKETAKSINLDEIDAVYSSDLRRAVHTAEIIFKKREIVKKPELREMNFGVFEGLTHEEILEKYSEVYTRWLNDPYSIRIPNGDYLPEYIERVCNCMSAIASENKGCAIAVTAHAGPIRVILNKISNQKNFWGTLPPSGSVHVVEYE
jgi:broad specificity phosphatase PhoE